MNTKYIIAILIIIIIGIGAFAVFTDWFENGLSPNTDDTIEDKVLEPRSDDNDDDSATSSDSQEDGENEDGSTETIGQSVEGNNIEAYHYGEGDTSLLFVGGIHGGYSWNTSLLGYRLTEWLEENPDVIPDNVRVTIIPVLNPDGLDEVVGTTTSEFTSADVPSREATVAGRFNANDVDLNRNFDCNWQSSGTWQNQTVDAGDEAFSEPEAQAFRDYVQENDPSAVVVYYSAAGGVYTSSCNGEVAEDSQQLMNAYADASGYSAEGEFTAYEISGDAVDWLAKIGVPGISVLLETHDSVEWERNQAGIEALFEQYAE